MGFSKAKYEKEITIVVTHKWHPDTTFAFTFPKQLPQAASDAETRFLGLGEDARADESRKALIELVAEMVTTEPEGFDDFPTDKQLPQGQAARSLSIRFRDYFDDPSQIELEHILVSAWRAYRAASVPSAYTKSLQNSSARDSQSSGATAQVQSEV